MISSLELLFLVSDYNFCDDIKVDQVQIKHSKYIHMKGKTCFLADGTDYVFWRTKTGEDL